MSKPAKRTHSRHSGANPWTLPANLCRPGSRTKYTYDRLGQVVSGKRYWQDGTPVAGQQFEYGFDDIGNRKTAATGGDASGTGLRVASYGANLLNQYTNRTVPGTVDILGVANPTAAVTVNGNTAYRKGDYFWQAVSVGNSSAAQYPLVTTISQYGAKATNTGNVYLPQTPEAFTHDADGNLTQDGRWDYTWDGENRLIAMQTRSAVLASGVPEQRLEFAYDPQSRRVSKTVSNKVSGAWARIVAQRFLYDGWNLLAILNPQSSMVQSFAWGVDLSGSLQGAGGVGGLLWVNDAATINGQPSTHAACYDGNGNVTALANFADGSLTARYDYGPFGEPIRQTGAMAEANPFCFSTKFTDNESGHIYYGYRYYVPYAGRWLSRDPIAESGGVPLYGFSHNCATVLFDSDGCIFGDVRSFTDLVIAALLRQQVAFLSESGEVLRAIKAEFREEVSAELLDRVKEAGCTPMRSWTLMVGERTRAAHFGGPMWGNPFSIDWGPYHYNFWTVHNASVTYKFSADLYSFGGQFCKCCYIAHVKLQASVMDTFEFLPDRPYNSIGNFMYNYWAGIITAIFNGMMGASVPVVYGEWVDEWDEGQCVTPATPFQW